MCCHFDFFISYLSEYYSAHVSLCSILFYNYQPCFLLLIIFSIIDFISKSLLDGTWYYVHCWCYWTKKTIRDPIYLIFFALLFKPRYLLSWSKNQQVTSHAFVQWMIHYCFNICNWYSNLLLSFIFSTDKCHLKMLLQAFKCTYCYAIH